MKKILIAEFKHETNSFAPDLTDEKKFRGRDYLFGDEITDRFRGAKNEIGAFLDCFEGKDEYRLIPVIAFNAQPGGIVAQTVFDTAIEKLTEALDKEGPFDGLLLALHGAMVVEHAQDGEGTLLKALRDKIGSEVPIIASLDLHTNLTKAMVDHATALFPYDYYPHTDTYDAAMRAAVCMCDTLEGKVKPVMKYCKLDMLMPYMPTALPVMKKHVEKAQSLRNSGNMINVNICHGFFAADIYEQGVAVVAVANGDGDLAQKTADEIGRGIWEERASFKRDFVELDDAIDELFADEGAPFVFADVSDNPGSGATGDTTVMLKRLIERGVRNAAFACIYDPETVEQASLAGVGASIDVRLGGKQCPDVGGGPICCKAYVKTLSDGVHYTRDYCPGTLTNLGKTAVLVIEGIEVLVTGIRTQAWDLEAFRINGISPERKKLICVKSAAHFRASYGTIAHKIIDIELPAIAPQSPKAMNYRFTRRPIYPLDEITE